ncbi:GlsB/YeaQ/YmgE family stress response membrane protein [Micromonospora olivasterospora]|uniref:GlsB/YeaQ/YmgE family stress response membrane protein n=1 Tax=Micromonospora olivasterospora TaxID=1880 RepID=A0A562IG73_MICOL|nr:GlsB/YeaQ/YmgE family stress response membrane protein [Micromonospora olivasterospora]TWH69892.1 hypothetical protein JD77_04909 [Micromonospora olivasterospora]
MTGVALVSALAVGLVVGALGGLMVPAPVAPRWLTLVAGVAAALLGAVLVRLAGVDGARLRLLDLLAPAGLAGVGVALVAATAGRADSAWARQTPSGTDRGPGEEHG